MHTHNCSLCHSDEHAYTGMRMYVCTYVCVCVWRLCTISTMYVCLPAGLDKLVEASTSVAELSEELVVKEKELAVASEKADHVLQEVTKKAHAAEKVKIAVQKVKDKAQALVDEIEAEKAVAQTKLAAAKPALDEAESALQVCAYMRMYQVCTLSTCVTEQAFYTPIMG